jgi:hypothetical protein
MLRGWIASAKLGLVAGLGRVLQVYYVVKFNLLYEDPRGFAAHRVMAALWPMVAHCASVQLGQNPSNQEHHLQGRPGVC